MRANPVLILAGNGVLLAAGLWFVTVQWRTGAALRAEVTPLRARAEEMARLRTENERLAARMVSDAELENLRADHAALDRLRTELAGLNRRTQERIRAPAVPPATSDMTPGAGPIQPAGEWKDAGQATPAAAFETALWAARHGKVDALKEVLAINSEGWEAIKAALAELPDSVRRNQWPPARFVAAFMAKDLSLASYQLLSREDRAPNFVSFTMRLRNADGTARDTEFHVHQIPAGYDYLTPAGGWRLVVPRDAVLRYLDLFKGAPPTAAGTGK